MMQVFDWWNGSQMYKEDMSTISFVKMANRIKMCENKRLYICK